MPVTAVIKLFKILTNKRPKLPRNNLNSNSAETGLADSQNLNNVNLTFLLNYKNTVSPIFVVPDQN